MLTLHAIPKIKLHVVAQIIETELVVSAVRDVRRVGFPAFFVVQVVHDHAHGQPEEAIKFPHPLRVTLGQVVIDCDHVYSATAERIQINREGSYQRFPFTGLHFCDLALVQYHATDKLHVEVSHLEDATTGLADNRESFDQNFVQRFINHLGPLVFELLDAVGVRIRLLWCAGQAFLDALPEFVSLGAQLVI